MAILTRAEAIKRTQDFIEENHPEWRPKKREHFEKFILASNILEKFAQKGETLKNYKLSPKTLENIFGSMDELLDVGRQILGEIPEEETLRNRKIWTPAEVEKSVIDWVERHAERGEKYPFPTFLDFQNSHLLPPYNSVREVIGISNVELYEKLFEEGKVSVKYSTDTPETVFHKSGDFFSIPECAHSSRKRSQMRETMYGRGY